MMADRGATEPVSSSASSRRATPAQKRSERTFERILDSSLRILDREGLAGFNTNAVAAEAGVNVSTLYHYFPDKNAILRELFIRTENERISYLATRISELETVDDVGPWVSDVIKVMAKRRHNNPGVSVLRSAMRVLPELRELEKKLDHPSVTALATAIRHRYPKTSSQRATHVATTIINMGVMMMDRADEVQIPAASVYKELAALITAYLTSLE